MGRVRSARWSGLNDGSQRVVVQSLESYFAQLRAAGEAERKTHDDLVARGWTWDAELRHYTHPDHPDTTIAY